MHPSWSHHGRATRRYHPTTFLSSAQAETNGVYGFNSGTTTAYQDTSSQRPWAPGQKPHTECVNTMMHRMTFLLNGPWEVVGGTCAQRQLAGPGPHNCSNGLVNFHAFRNWQT